MTRKTPRATAKTAPSAGNAAEDSDAAPMAPRKTKAAHLRDLVGAPGGASLSSLMAATGWQAHTVRAALTGLRKQGLTIERRREGDETIYQLREGPATPVARTTGAEA